MEWKEQKEKKVQNRRNLFSISKWKKITHTHTRAFGGKIVDANFCKRLAIRKVTHLFISCLNAHFHKSLWIWNYLFSFASARTHVLTYSHTPIFFPVFHVSSISVSYWESFKHVRIVYTCIWVWFSKKKFIWLFSPSPSHSCTA